MRKLLCIVLLITTSNFYSQVSLEQLASGTLQLFTPIKDVNSSVYGYLSIYMLEKVSKTETRYEYVILDKNLNKVSNGEFKDANYRHLSSRFYYPEKIGNQLIISKKYSHSFNQVVTFTSHRILDLKSNKISKEFYFNGTEYIEGRRPPKRLNSTLKKIKKVDFPISFGKGFFRSEYSKSQKAVKNLNTVQAYSIKGDGTWSYNYNPNNERIDKVFDLINGEDLFITTRNLTTKEIIINSINPEDGSLIFSYTIQNEDSKYAYSYDVQKSDGNFVIAGVVSRQGRNGYQWDKTLGYFRVILDKEGNKLSEDLFFWEDASKFIKMGTYGKMDKGYYLNTKSIFVFNEGKISILTEKRKPSKGGLFSAGPKTTDFAILNFDKDFNFVDITTIEKEKSKWSYSDYLYSQKIKKGNGVVFFYNDYKKNKETKEKNWILGIVTIINGKMTHEKIPMSSKEHFIVPYISKEGYILIREYNKDSDYNQIRLERLNY